MDTISLTDIKDILELKEPGSKCEMWFETESGSEMLLVFSLSKSGKRVTTRYTIDSVKYSEFNFEKVVVDEITSIFNEAPRIII